MNLIRQLGFTLAPQGQAVKQISFPVTGLCSIVLGASSLFSYELRCIDTDINYSDKPIPCSGTRNLLPLSNYEGRTLSFDFHNTLNKKNHITLEAKFEPSPFSAKYYSFREYTLGGLFMKSPVEIEPGGEVEVSLTNFRGGHFEVHEIHSPIHEGPSCKIEYHDRIIKDFYLEAGYRFDKPWTLKWTDSVVLRFANRGNSKLTIGPTEIYFAGYLLKPAKEIGKIAPINLRNSFLIEGIRLP